jgi:hypothetical protein
VKNHLIRTVADRQGCAYACRAGCYINRDLSGEIALPHSSDAEEQSAPPEELVYHCFQLILVNMSHKNMPLPETKAYF